MSLDSGFEIAEPLATNHHVLGFLAGNRRATQKLQRSLHHLNLRHHALLKPAATAYAPMETRSFTHHTARSLQIRTRLPIASCPTTDEFIVIPVTFAEVSQITTPFCTIDAAPSIRPP